ncbi:MAG: sensor domain-containing protein [Gammaproteobacteria bacterium]
MAGVSGTFTDMSDRQQAEAALRDSEDRLQRVLDALPMAAYTCDTDGLITYFNARAVELWGRSPRLGDSEDRFCGSFRLFLPDGTPLSHDRCWMAVAVAERRAIHGEEVVIERPDGSRRTAVAHANPLYDRAGRPTGAVNVLVDITEQKANEEALRESNERFQLVARVTTDSVWDWDIRRNNFRQYNHFDSSIGDRSTGSEEIPWTERVHPDDRERVMDGVFAAIKGEKNDWSDEYRLGRRDGGYAQVEDRGFIVRDGQGRAVRMVGATLDITERKVAEARIEALAYHDPLTGLPNRALLLDRLTQTLALAEREQRPSAVLFLDLDRFKAINDSLGHAVGDELLRQAAERLRTAIRKEDTVARIGGDEFVILMAEIGDAENAAGIASKVLAALRVPFVIEEHELSISASCGIAISPADGTEAPVLLQRADTALYQCKADGGGYRLFDREIDRRAHARLQLEQGLRRAIERGEFLLHYQAQIDLANGTVTGAEALVRWQHPEGRLVPPGEFIPLAENMGYIGAIGEWVLREACTEALRWPPALRVSVNVSARQLTQPDFTATVREILEETGLPPGRLEIEITESALMSDPARAIATLEELQQLGIQIAMDDFGTGYSSLGQLKRLPLQRLKIDKSFVQDVPDDPNEVVIVEAILGLARQLKRSVVAEGVETESQLEFLRKRGCDEAQGYWIAKPIPAAEFRALLSGSTMPLLK